MSPLRPSLDVSTWGEIRDASGWPIVAEENRGLREKVWVEGPGGLVFLRKRHRLVRPYEPAVEVFALELARAVDLPAARATLAEWKSGRGETHRGVCVLSFLDDKKAELLAGNEALRSVDSSYDGEDRWIHTVPRVVAALTSLEKKHGARLVHAFGRILLFDGWIGNGDRHPGNWSLIRRGSSMTMSPMYDPASCLGAELADDAMELHPPPATRGAQVADYKRRLSRYVRNCPSGFGDGERQLKLRRVLEDASALGVLPLAELDNYAARLADTVPQLLNSFDDERFPPVRKRFAAAILSQRLEFLRGLRAA